MLRPLRFVARLVVLAVLAGGLAAVGRTPARAVTVSTVVENVAVDVGGGGRLTIKRIEVGGSGSSGADLVALFDRASPKPLVDRLRAFDAPSIVMPEVVAEYPLGEVKVRKIYRDVRLVDVVHGRIGAASVGRITLTLSEGTRQPIRGDIGEVTARNVDLVLLARLFTVARPQAGEPPTPIFDYLALGSIAVDVPHELHVAVEHIALGRLMARALTVPLADLPGRIQSIDGSGQPRRAREKALILIAKDMIEGSALGSFELRGLEVTNPREPAPLRIDRIAIADVAQPKVGEIAIEGIDFTAPDARFQVNAANLRGLDLRTFFDRINLMLAESAPGDGLQTRSLIPGFDRLVVEGVRLMPSARELAIDPGHDASDLLRLDRLQVNAADQFNGIPGALFARADGLQIGKKIGFQNELLRPLQQLGYDKLEVPTARLDLAWNAAKREIVLQASGEAKGIGSLAMAGNIGNAGQELFSTDPTAEQAAALGMVFKRADITVRNTGLVEKFVAFRAKDMGISPDELRRKMVSDAAVELPAQLGDARAAKTIGNALAKFAAQPQSLHFTATSADGLGFPEIAASRSPADILDRLDVTAVANE